MSPNLIGPDTGAWRRNPSKRFNGTVNSLLRGLTFLNDEDLRRGLVTNAQSIGVREEEIIFGAYSKLQDLVNTGEITEEEFSTNLERLAISIDTTPQEIIEASKPRKEDDSETSRIS